MGSRHSKRVQKASTCGKRSPQASVVSKTNLALGEGEIELEVFKMYANGHDVNGDFQCQSFSASGSSFQDEVENGFVLLTFCEEDIAEYVRISQQDEERSPHVICEKVSSAVLLNPAHAQTSAGASRNFENGTSFANDRNNVRVRPAHPHIKDVRKCYQICLETTPTERVSSTHPEFSGAESKSTRSPLKHVSLVPKVNPSSPRRAEKVSRRRTTSLSSTGSSYRSTSSSVTEAFTDDEEDDIDAELQWLTDAVDPFQAVAEPELWRTPPDVGGGLTLDGAFIGDDRCSLGGEKKGDGVARENQCRVEEELDWLCEPEWNNLELEIFWHVLRPHLEGLLLQHPATLPEPCSAVCKMDASDCSMLDRCLLHVQWHIWKGNYQQAVSDFLAIKRHFLCVAKSHLLESDRRDDVECMRLIFQRKRPPRYRLWI